ncbi:hypothetical protein L1049_018594 [Liquidambar formosana]|uniref:Uncharacterized protein n=1 Tax=Liquidambar formosana TaxID=63359 RepID=A0AAP0RAB1_LIQFO
MAGEIGVIFNIPQPFTVRTKRLSQVIRISHHHFKQLVQPLNEDGKTIISNFVQYLKGLKKEMLEEIPFLTELLGDLNIEVNLHIQPNKCAKRIVNDDREYRITYLAVIEQGSDTLSSTFPMRLVIHGHHPNENTMEGDKMGKLIHLPDSIEDLFRLAEKKFGKRGNMILMDDGSLVEDLNVLRENDHLFII